MNCPDCEHGVGFHRLSDIYDEGSASYKQIIRCLYLQGNAGLFRTPIFCGCRRKP